MDLAYEDASDCAEYYLRIRPDPFHVESTSDDSLRVMDSQSEVSDRETDEDSSEDEMVFDGGCVVNNLEDPYEVAVSYGRHPTLFDYVHVRPPHVPYGQHVLPPPSLDEVELYGEGCLDLMGQGVEHSMFVKLFVQCPACSLFFFGASFLPHACGSDKPRREDLFNMWEHGLPRDVFDKLFVRCTSCLLYLTADSYEFHVQCLG
ncbi:hypothetical protein ONZ45_g17319 [Pleurotus djamor]|nr:hypothetical protein ONZ45_g17319 [Pleurotus djamor]